MSMFKIVLAISTPNKPHSVRPQRYSVAAVEFELGGELSPKDAAICRDYISANKAGAHFGVEPPKDVEKFTTGGETAHRGMGRWNDVLCHNHNSYNKNRAQWALRLLEKIGVLRAVRIVPAIEQEALTRWERANAALTVLAGREIPLHQTYVSLSGTIYARTAAVVNDAAEYAAPTFSFLLSRGTMTEKPYFEEDYKMKRIVSILEQYKLKWSDIADHYSRGQSGISQQGGLLRVSDHPHTPAEGRPRVALTVLTDGRCSQASLDDARNYLRRVKSAAGEIRSILAMEL